MMVSRIICFALLIAIDKAVLLQAQFCNAPAGSQGLAESSDCMAAGFRHSYASLPYPMLPRVAGRPFKELRDFLK